jgi:hypothetical protein
LTESVDYKLAQMREQIESIIASNEAKHDMRNEYSERAVAAATQAMDHRLAGMNEIRGALADLSSNMITRTEAEVAINSLASKTRADFDALEAKSSSSILPLVTKMEEYGKTNWPLMISMAGVVLGVIAGGWVVVGLKIDTNNAPVMLAVEQIKVSAASNSRLISALSDQTSRLESANTVQQQQITADHAILGQIADRARQIESGQAASTQADGVSRSDRAQLNERTRALETSFAREEASRREAGAGFAASLVEIETQMKSLSVAINVQEDHNQQLFGVMWSSLFPQNPLPPTNFRPQLYK